MATGDKLERKYLCHFIDASFGGQTANWVRLGKDLEDYSEELNPDVEIRKNILGEQSVTHSGYEVSSEVGDYKAYEGDPLFEQLCTIANERKTGKECATKITDVLVDGTGATTWAYQENVIVIPSSVGGDTSGINVPFTIYRDGGRVELDASKVTVSGGTLTITT